MESMELPPDDHRTQWLLKQQAYLQIIAAGEIDRRLAGKFDCSDLIQQTLMEAWKCWDDFRGSDHAQRLAWLRKILAFQMAKQVRRYCGTQQRDVAIELHLEHRIEDAVNRSAANLDAILAASDPTPSEYALANEQQHGLAEALLRLPDDYRKVIQLRNIDELPFSEIADLLGRSEAAIRMLWIRALAALAKQIREPEG